MVWLTWSPDAFGTTCKTSKLPGPIPVLHQLMKLAAMWFCAKESRSGFDCILYSSALFKQYNINPNNTHATIARV